MKGYPGMSGGPVCVQSFTSLGTNFFIPAGVYLGEGDSSQSIVRAINVDVADLINRAEDSGKVGTNHNGGGVVLFTTTTGSDLTHPCTIVVRFGPPLAIQQGGAWRVSPTDFGELKNLTTYTTNSVTVSVRSGNFTIEVRDLPGFITP